MKKILCGLIFMSLCIGSVQAQDSDVVKKIPLILTQHEVYKQIQSRIIEQLNTKVLSVVKIFSKFQTSRIGKIIIPKPIPIPIPIPIPKPKPKWVEMRGILKKINHPATDRRIRATLLNNAGKIIARLKSTVINLDSYDGLMVLVAGYQIYPFPIPLLEVDNDATPIPRIPVIDVKRIKVLSKWVQMQGLIKGLDVMIQAHATPSLLKTYHAMLYDGNGSLKANLISKTIPLPRYDGMKVRIYGYQLPVLSANTDADNDAVSIIPLIDVRRIYLFPRWVVKRGFLKSRLPKPIPLPQPIPLLSPALNGLAADQPNIIKPQIIYNGRLYDNDGVMKARLYSKTIPLPRYNGFYVEVAGYQHYPNILPVRELTSDNVSIDPTTPVIDVRRIKIIFIPPPIETWKGIVRPRTDDSNIAPECRYILTDQNGTVIGYLSAKTDEISDLLKKYSIHYLVAVTGAVYPILNSTSSYEIKKMVVSKIRLLQDLRHIIWMNNRPLFFRVGEEIAFNKIGDIIKPITLSSDSSENVDITSDETSAAQLFLYQKNWDFNEKLYPMPLIDNDTTASSISESDNEVIQCIVPVDFTQYDYKYDSRIKCADGIIKCVDNPTYKYKKPGIYKVTLTCTLIDRMGFVKKIETASRIIQIFPWFELNDDTALILDEVLDDCAAAQCQTKEGVSNALKEKHDTARAIIFNMR
ncbi:hypothetical protein J7L67_08255 [bacterium]|nr:hypothetical protein [bacterium]